MNNFKTNLTKTRLFIDVANKKASVVKLIGSINPRREEYSFPFAKDAKVYGVNSSIQHLKDVYSPNEVIFCEL